MESLSLTWVFLCVGDGCLSSSPALALTAVAGWVHSAKDTEVGERYFFGQLLVDVCALSSLLYLSGGSTNPLVSLYLLPLVVAATTMPGRYAWAMAALTAACYTLLFFLPPAAPDEPRRPPRARIRTASGRHVGNVSGVRGDHRVLHRSYGRGDPRTRRAARAPERRSAAQRTHRCVGYSRGGGGARTRNTLVYDGGGAG